VLIHIPGFSDAPILCARYRNRVEHIYGLASLHRDHFGFDVEDFLNRLTTKDLFLPPFRDQKPSLKKNESCDIPITVFPWRERDSHS
jgi:hypothetical protein